MDFIEKVGSTVSQKGQEALDKAKEFAEIAKLKSQIAACNDVIKKYYMEIGKNYVEQNAGNEEAVFARQVTAVLNAQKGIEEIEKQIRDIKQRGEEEDS